MTEAEWILIVQIASLCPCELMQISAISCKVISSERMQVASGSSATGFKYQGDVKEANLILGFTGQDISSRQREWVWLECGGGSAESPWRSVPSRASSFRREGSSQGGEIGQGTKLSRCKATTAQLVYSAEVGGERLSPYHLFKVIYAKRQWWFRNKRVLSDLENSECNFCKRFKTTEDERFWNSLPRRLEEEKPNLY